MSIELVLLAVLFIWLMGLSIYVYTTLTKFSKLTKDIKKGDLLDLLDKVIKVEVTNKKTISSLAKDLTLFREESRRNVQKTGLVRFNPFNELGGDHSFSLCLLNADNTGFIITGLHTRERTRVYIKKIIEGKSKRELSSEENKSLKIAMDSK